MFTIACLALFCLVQGQGSTQRFINSDIDRFWTAYDKIVATTDTAEQRALLNTHFLDHATPGLTAFMGVRNYGADEYLVAIHSYPLFWKSVRQNTQHVSDVFPAVEAELVNLRKYYPALRPADLCFTIGALRSGGTVGNGMVLIGSELAFADHNTVSSEFPDRMATNRREYFDSDPIEDVVLLAIHEYVHTQQKPLVHNLLSQCVYEGVGEYVSTLVTGRPSTLPAIPFGKANTERVREAFEKDLFNFLVPGKWMWSDDPNAFNVRDMGYYVGYTMCEMYFNKANDKQKAITELIELDYTDEAAFGSFVEATGYLSQPLDTLFARFERTRPTVVTVEPFVNGDTSVKPGLTRITVRFSEPMDVNFRNFDYGPVGEEFSLRIKEVIGFSEDHRSITFDVDLAPGRRHQMTVANRFRNEQGIPLRPYVIDISTTSE